MKIFQSLKRNTKLNSFQSKNKAALECLIKCGFLMPKIRKGLMVLNGVKMADLAENVSIVSVSNTIKGRQRNKDVMFKLSDELKVGVDLLFPDDGG